MAEQGQGLRLLAGRIEAAKAIVQGAAPEEKAAQSAAQASAITTMVATLAVEKGRQEALMTEIDSLSAKLATVGFEDSDLARTLDSLNSLIEALPGKAKKHSKMQYFTNCLQYIKGHEWDRILACMQRFMPDALRQIETNLLLRNEELGCEHPSEPTTKLWTAFLISLQYKNLQQAVALGPVILAREHARIKTAFKKIKNDEVPESNRVMILPPLPETFRAYCHEMYTSVFGDQKPGVCRANLHFIQQIGKLWACRGGQLGLTMGVPLSNAHSFAGPYGGGQLSLTDSCRSMVQAEVAQLRMELAPKALRESPTSKLALEDGHLDHGLSLRRPCSSDSLGSAHSTGSPEPDHQDTTPKPDRGLTFCGALKGGDGEKEKESSSECVMAAMRERKANKLKEAAGAESDSPDESVGDDSKGKGPAASKGAPVLKKPASQKKAKGVGKKSGPISLKLSLESSRNTWVARMKEPSGTTAKSFHFGKGCEFSTSKTAEAACRAHLNTLAKKHGSKSRFPADQKSMGI